MLPSASSQTGAGIVAADRLVAVEQGRDRFAELPGELAGRIRFAFVDLRAFGMQRRDHGFAGDANCIRRIGGEGRRQRQQRAERHPVRSMNGRASKVDGGDFHGTPPRRPSVIARPAAASRTRAGSGPISTFGHRRLNDRNVRNHLPERREAPGRAATNENDRATVSEINVRGRSGLMRRCISRPCKRRGFRALVLPNRPSGRMRFAIPVTNPGRACMISMYSLVAPLAPVRFPGSRRPRRLGVSVRNGRV